MKFHSLKSQFISNFIFPAYHILLNDTLWDTIKKYNKSQWEPEYKLKELQKHKLLKLLNHCQNNVPYYKNLFKSIGLKFKKSNDLKNFCEIPFLTKEIINKNSKNILASNINKKNLVSNSTSGSTGQNLLFFQDKKSMLCRQAVVWRNQEWVDCLYADKQAFLWGAPFDLKRSQKLLGKIHMMLTQKINLSAYDLSDQSLQNYEKILNKYKPKLLVSYPSPLELFSDFLLANNKKIRSIEAIITSAETLYPLQRKTIEKAFGCQIFDRYGTREFGNIAHECDKHEGYHINIERFFLEILDENGKATKNKEIGEIVITDLDNYGFPFIRYKIEDLAIASNRKCSCGRGLPLLERIEGRAFDVIRGPNGNQVAGTFWTLALRSIKGVKNFQIIQNSINEIELKIITNNEYNSDDKAKIEKIIKDKCGDEIKIKINHVNKIPLTKSGKRRFVISNLD
jgi:phenylacetate-CoA ligase